MTVLVRAKDTPNEVGVQQVDDKLFPFTGCCGARVTPDPYLATIGWCAKCKEQQLGLFTYVCWQVTDESLSDIIVQVEKWTGLSRNNFYVRIDDMD